MKTNQTRKVRKEAVQIEQDGLSSEELKRSVECNHEWVVFSTALQDVCLMLECVSCGALGTVDDPSEEEWGEAFHAPDEPYGWPDKARVTIRGVPGYRHVYKAG